MEINSSPNQYTKEGVLEKFWELIDQTVKCFSDKVFIVSKSGRLTYREVIHRGNVICALLTGQTSRRKVGVGLFTREPLKIIPAMLGVLKAGHYFVPLDVAFPAGTLNTILDNAEIKIIISDQDNIVKLKSLDKPGITLIDYDLIDEVIIYERNAWFISR